MYHRVLFLLCILSLIQIIRSQEGYEPEFIIIQPPSPSPPTDYDPHATIKSEPYVEAKVEGASKSKEDSKLSTPPAKIEETPKSASHETEPKAKVSKPESTVAPTKAEPTPPPQSHPKAIPQKVEAKKEPKIAEISSSPQAADEPKAPPQNFKHDDCLSDTIFVIDSTSSVRNLFEQHRVYASNVVKEMDISPETNHIGVVLYSSKQRQSIKISLSDPQRKDNITAKINSLPYLSGITATGAALHLTIKDLEHRRQNAMTNVVVISDGFSYDLVEEPVKQLQQLSNVRIFAVSLGESYRKFEMLMIASHEENFLTGADSYKELVRRLHQCNEGLRKGDKSETKVDETATGVTESPSSQGQTTASTATTTKTPKKEVINKVKSTEKNVVKSSESSESSEEKEAVLATTKTPKPTTEKPKPTTEKPSSTKSTQKPSPKPVEIKKSEISKKKKIEAVKSSEEKKSVEVKKPEVAPKKDSSSGNDKKDVIKNKDCRYDIVFVIDASGSLRKRYQHQLEIASKLIDKFDFEKTQIAVIRYSGRKRSKVAISLGSKHSKEEFNKAFLHMPFMGGTTYTDEALDKAFIEITGSNVRADALPMVIVFTDGFSQPDPAENAKKLHAKSIPTFAIGITDGQIVNENELRSIASTPKNVFLDSNINELEQLFVQLSENC